MKIKQSEEYRGDDWWDWGVWVEGTEVRDVEKVIWHLHPTFPQATREATDPSTNFRLDTSGWGTFPIRAEVLMKDGTIKKLRHELELHYPDDTSNETKR